MAYINASKNAGFKKNRRVQEKEYVNASAREEEKNKGGLLGGAGYLMENLGLGLAGVGEGVGDLLSAGGDFLRGDTEMAKYRFLDNQTAEAQEKLRQAYNPGFLMEFAGDVASSMGQNSLFLLDTVAPGLGTGLFYAGVSGRGISSAAQMTGDVGPRELAYGVISGFTEGTLEKVFGVGAKVAGKLGAGLSRSAGATVGKKGIQTALTKSAGARAWSSIAKATAKDMTGEFAEEFASEYIDTGLLLVLGIDPNASTSLGEALRAGMVGAVSGGVMGAPANVYNFKNSAKAGKAIRESGETENLLNRAQATVSVLKEQEAVKRAEGKRVKLSRDPEAASAEDGGEAPAQKATAQGAQEKGEQAKGEQAAQEQIGFFGRMSAKLEASRAKSYAAKLEKNINGYKSLSESVRNSEAGDALLGELRGNLYFTNMAYAVEEAEIVLRNVDDAQANEIVKYINTEAKKKNQPKSDYTVEDFRLNRDGILSQFAALGRMEQILKGDWSEAEEIAEQAKEAERAERMGSSASSASTASAVNTTVQPKEAPRAAEVDTGRQEPAQSPKPAEDKFEPTERSLRQSAERLGLSKVETDVMVNTYKWGSPMDADTFSKAFAEGVYYGRQNRRAEDVPKNTLLYNMKPEERAQAINAGRLGISADTERRAALAAQKTAPAPTVSNRVRLELKDGVPMHQRGDRDYAVYNASKIIGSALNADVVIHDTLGEKSGGKLNGYFDRKGNTIHVALDAGKDASGTALYTLAHETTHYVREWSPEKYQVLSDFIGERMSSRGEDMDAMIATKKELLRSMKEFKDLSDSALTDAAHEEVIADAMETVLSDGKVLQELATRDKSLWEKVKAWVREAIARLKATYAELKPNSQAAKVLTETMTSMEELERLFTEGVTAAGERAKGAGVETETEIKGEEIEVRYSVKTEYDSEKAGIADQIRNSQEKLNQMDPVYIASVPNNVGNKEQGGTWAISELKKYGFRADRQNFGTIFFDEKSIRDAMNYLDTNEEKASIVAIFKVLKQGIVVGEHGDHKSRSKHTITFGAPVVLNGIRGNMAVVVNMRNNKYYVHRILMPDGSTFRFDVKQKDAKQESQRGVPKGSLANATSSASDSSIPHPSDSVNSKFSISEENSSDEAYLAAVESGDMETAQRMVDEAAKAAGYKVKAYHGTNAEFTVFDKNRVGKGIDQYGAGFYFASNEDVTERYGNRKYDVYLSLKKPIQLLNRARGEGKSLYDVKITQTQAYKILKKHPMMYDPEESPLGDFYDDYWEVGPKEWMIKDLAKQYTNIGDLDADVILYRNYPNELHEAIREVIGYDGVEVYFESDEMVDERNDYFYVAWFDNQMKSADPVTYDSNGKVIPLSERFKESDPDIRYSVDDTAEAAESPDVSDASNAENETGTNDGDIEAVELTDRDLLLAMAEQMVGSEEEYRIVADYKEGYDDIRAKQERVDELTDRQRELQSVMFTGAEAEARSNAAKELKEVRDELNSLLDEVAKADQKLAEIEGMKVIRNLITRERLNVRDTYKTKYEGMYKQRVKARATTEKRRQVRRIYSRVNRLLFSPTRTRNVPVGLQGFVAEALKAANMDVDAMERLAQLEEQLSREVREAVPDEGKIRKLEEQITAQEKKIGSIKEQTQFLIELIEATNDKDADGDTRLIFDEDALQKLKDLQKDIGKASIRGMDLEQLTALKDFYDIVHHRLTKANNLLASERKINVSEMGEKASHEAADAKELKLMSPKPMEIAGLDSVRRFFWKNMKPLTVFEAIGSDTFTGLFRNVLDGENVWAKDIIEAREKIVKLKEKYGYDKWDVEARKTVKTSAGDVQLSISQIMSLFAYSFREQARIHLMGGGFVIDPNATTKAKGEKLKFAELERRLNDATRHTMTEADINRMYEYLTEEQKSFVKDMQAYLTSLGKKGNDVSRKLYGIEIFGENFYFPIKVSSEYLRSELEKTGDPKIKNRGMTKEVTPNAKDPLVLQDFMDVAVEHINSMATYHAFVLPMEDLTRVLNYKPVNYKRDKDGNVMIDESGKPIADEDAAVQYDTLKSVIKAKYGKEAISYIEQLMRDLNGGARRDAAAGIIDRGITAFKRASTMASLSVLVQQPTSILRAAAYIDYKYLFGNAKIVDFKNHKELWERVKKYAPVAAIKEMGGYDTGVGARTEEYLNSKEYGKGERLKGFLKDESYRAEVFGKGASYADEMAWIQLFEACVSEQADKLGKDRDSEEVLTAAGERFTEVVRHTQVYDSTLTRTESMRSKDTGAKMFTAFMAEPSTVVSMVAEAIMKAERGDTGFLRATAGAVAGSIILNALFSSLVYAMRDDDEDKSYEEKYLSTLAMEVAEGFNPAEYLPYTRDIMSLIKGYEIERSDMTLIGDLVNSIRNIAGSKQTVGQKMQNVGTAVASFFGLPVANVMRDVNGAIFTFFKSVDTERFTGKGLSVALKEEFDIMWGLWDEETTNGYQLYRSAIDEDGKHFARVAARYETDKEVEQALRKALRSYDKRIHEAAMAKMEGELEVYEELIGQIVGEGHFDRNITIRAINNQISYIKDHLEDDTVPEDPAEEDTPESIYSTSDLNAALERGDSEDFTWVYHTLMAYKKEQGTTEAQARSSIKSSVTSYWKKQYLAAWEKNNSAEMRRILKILLDTGLYGNHNDTATTLQGWVKTYAKSKIKK